MKRISATFAALAMLAAGCTGGDDDGGEGPTLPLPDKAPSAAGPAKGPAMDPRVLLAASDELEETAGEVDTAQVDRRSGAFVSGRTVVGYSVDDISGYDLDSGEQLWTSDLDLGSGTVCFVSQPDRAVKQFTVAYGESEYCPNLATISVADGTVLKKSQGLQEINEFEGESAGGTVNHLFTVKGKDYLVDMRGVVWVMKAGEPEPIARLESDGYFNLYPTPQGDRLIGSRSNDPGQCRVDAYAIPSFEPEWTTDNDALFPDAREDCIISAAAGNPAWLLQQDGDTYTMVQVDPATGKVLGRASAPTQSEGPTPRGEFNLASAANQFDRAWGLPNGDMVFVQVGGMVRYSLADEKVDWSVDLSQTELESSEDYPLTTVLPSGVTPDGYLISSVSNNTAVEIDAVNVETGKLAARWPVATEYRNGFQVEPGMTLFDGGVVMSRNFEAWEFTFADYREDLTEPEGDRFDLGVFEFPEPDNEVSTEVPSTGPTDTEAVELASVKASDSAEDATAGTIAAGSRLVVYSGSTVSGVDPTSGKRAWKTELPGGQRVCSSTDLDRSVKIFSLAVTTEGEKKPCTTVVRVRTSDGTILDTAKTLGTDNEVYRIETYDGQTFVQTSDGTVQAWKAGALVEVADLGRTFGYWEKTPTDPSLRIGTSRVDDGKDWVIEAYQLPGYEKVWSTTGTQVLGAVDPNASVAAWRGNGLWIWSQFGDTSDPEATVDDALSVLDAETGEVVRKTGRVERDYLADDLKKFSLTAAGVSNYQTAGFENGDVVLEQSKGIMRYAADGTIRWAVDTSSIQNSMEQADGFVYLNQDFQVIDGGKTVLVTMSNGTSVELMTLSAEDGTITGRWKLPAEYRNGLQSSPEVTPVGSNVALTRSGLGEDAESSEQNGAKLDVGYFQLPRPKKD